MPGQWDIGDGSRVELRHRRTGSAYLGPVGATLRELVEECAASLGLVVEPAPRPEPDGEEVEDG